MKVAIEKPDLDTCLAAVILGVTKDDHILIVKGGASRILLEDPSVLCIEVGGSGKIEKNNFDHHNTPYYLPPACMQAYRVSDKRSKELKRLVDYVCQVDEGICHSYPISFPSLSNIFSGMFLVEKDTFLRFIKGMEILGTVLKNGLDPFRSMPELSEWRQYIRAKIENQKMLESTLSSCQIYTSKKGVKVGFLEHRFIGGIGALFKMGCQIAILFNPCFGHPPIRKCTIASNGIRIDMLKSIFNGIEPGWGGRDTILGSPLKQGTSLSRQEIIRIVLENL